MRPLPKLAALALAAPLLVSAPAVSGAEHDAGKVEAVRALAEQGDATAQRQLGLVYYEGKGVPQDYEKAAHWYRMAAEQGDAYGQAMLGVMYLDGRGVPQDDVQAYAWLDLAAAGGFEPAREGRDELLERMSPEQVSEGQALSRDLAAKLRE